jgi:hypothetical protein
VQVIALLIDQQLGVSNDVDEQDMRDLQTQLGFRDIAHEVLLFTQSVLFYEAN